MGLTFNLGRDSAALTSDASLNVGIGGSPSGSYKLEVTGTAKVSSTLLVGGASTLTGNVGVGATPVSLLYAYSASGTAELRLERGGAGDVGMRWKKNSADLGYISNADWIIAGASTTDFAVNAVNNLVLGTASTARLTIASTGAATFSSSITMLGDNLVLNGTNTAIVFQNAGSTKGYNAIVTSTGAYVPGSIINDIIYRSNGNNFLWSVDSGSSCAMKLTSGGQLQIKQAANTHSGDGLTLYNTGNQYWNFVNGGDSNLYLGYGGTSKGYYSSSTGVYTALSDINKKKDFEESTIGLDAVLGLKPTLYRMKDDEETIEKHLGFIAQEVKEFIPQAYSESVNGEDTFIGLDYQSITATLVKAIQELSAQNQDLKSRLDKAGL